MGTSDQPSNWIQELLSCVGGIPWNSSSSSTWGTKTIRRANGRSLAECYLAHGLFLAPKTVQVVRSCATWRLLTGFRHRLVGTACATLNIGTGVPAVVGCLERDAAPPTSSSDDHGALKSFEETK